MATPAKTFLGRLLAFGSDVSDVPEGFLQENRRLLVSRTRLLIRIALGLLVVSIPVDYFRVPVDRYAEAVALRLFGCAVLLPILPLLSRSFAERWAEWLAGVVFILLSGITIAMAPLFAKGAADPSYASLIMGTVFLVLGSGLLLPLEGRTMALLGGILFLLHVAFTIDFAPGQNLPALFATLVAVTIATIGMQQTFVGRLNEYRVRVTQAGLLAAREEVLRAQDTLIQVRADFVAMLTHDIKNPLSAIMGLTEMLREQLREGSDPEQTIDTIESSAQQAMTLAINFLDAERIQSGVLELQRTSISPNGVIERVLRHQTPRSRVRHVTLRSDLSADVPALDLDEPLVDRVFANLVGNAIDHSPVGSEVTITTRLHERRVVVEVRDRGRGVPPEDRPKLFQRYSRGAGSRTDSTGLGLFVVKTIVEAHGGSVEVRSPPEGGSIFEVSLPVQTRDQPPKPQ